MNIYDDLPEDSNPFAVDALEKYRVETPPVIMLASMRFHLSETGRGMEAICDGMGMECKQLTQGQLTNTPLAQTKVRIIYGL